MTGQNTSHAVMAQRHEPPDSLDFFPTPPWATRALVECVLANQLHQAGAFADGVCWEPACGEGHMARPLMEYFGTVHATDCHDYGYGQVHDFLMPGGLFHPVDWIITNPPFVLGKEFIHQGRGLARKGVAVLVRSVFTESKDRYENLFRDDPPTVIAQFVERVPMVKGRLDPKASSATAYLWMVWMEHCAPQPFMWIPPCRKQLERADDYDAPEAA